MKKKIMHCSPTYLPKTVTISATLMGGLKKSEPPPGGFGKKIRYLRMTGGIWLFWVFAAWRKSVLEGKIAGSMF